MTHIEARLREQMDAAIERAPAVTAWARRRLHHMDRARDIQPSTTVTEGHPRSVLIEDQERPLVWLER